MVARLSTKKYIFFLASLIVMSVYAFSFFDWEVQKETSTTFIHSPPSNISNVVVATNIFSSKHFEKELIEEVIELNYDDEWCNYSELNEESSAEADMEHEDWMISRGHFSGQFNGYEAYSVEQLRELGSGGDLRALYALVYIKDTKQDLKYWAAKNAAVYGGTGLTMAYISTRYAQRYAQLLAENKNIEAKKALLESLAWNEFAAMRGDFIHLEMGIYIAGQKTKGIEVTESDISIVSAKAQNIYHELRRIRRNKGLDDFNNDLPKIIKQKNEWAIASLLSKGWNGWGQQYLVKSECVDKNIVSFSKKI